MAANEASELRAAEPRVQQKSPMPLTTKLYGSGGFNGAYVDSRFSNAAGFNGYTYGLATVVGLPTGIGTATPTEFGIMAYPVTGVARYTYAIGVDQVVRYEGHIAPATADPVGLVAGAPIGKR
jgi:hypothetical protein